MPPTLLHVGRMAPSLRGVRVEGAWPPRYAVAYRMPCAIMASATFTKPAMLAPLT